MLQTISSTDALPKYFPAEYKFIREWFETVIMEFEAYGKLDLTRFQNYAINFEFFQPSDYVNKIDFDELGGAILTTQKVIVEYHIKKKGYFSNTAIIEVFKKNRFSKRKSLRQAA